MKLDFKQAWNNIFNQDGWTTKGIILFIIFVIVSLLTPENNSELNKTAIGKCIHLESNLTLLSAIKAFFYGYLLKYLHDLMINPKAPLPKWEKIGEIFLIGFKPVLCWFLVSILGIGLIISLLSAPILLGIIITALIYLVFALILVYAKDFKMANLLNVKEAVGYSSIAYLQCFISIVGYIIISAVLPPVIKTILFVPMVLTFINILAQVHHQQAEKGKVVPVYDENI